MCIRRLCVGDKPIGGWTTVGENFFTNYGVNALDDAIQYAIANNVDPGDIRVVEGDGRDVTHMWRYWIAEKFGLTIE